ncbi:ABC transporter permease [Georgenia faecalis]|uniref:ABC transporter permease n=1 Tax=Georgenia faecalis TaxID=2483799 RepID=A0ABV9D736_9MICO|nr:ABC transporter permease [Georgenia faecalis]
MSTPGKKSSGTGSAAAVGLVAKREFKARFLTKSNLISLALLVAVIVAGIIALDFFANQDSEEAAYTVGVDDDGAALEGPLRSAAAGMGTTVDIVEMDRSQAETELTDGLDAFLTGDPTAPELVVEEEAAPQLLALVTAAVQAHALGVQIDELGGDPAAVDQALATAVPSVTALEPPDETGGMSGPAYFVALLMLSLLLFVLISTGSIIAMSVVEEKTSRVVEILLATIRPTQLLAGKILGTGVVGLVQVSLLAGSAGLAMAATGLLDGFQIDLSTTMLMTLLWFLLGYAIFALLFGGFAALVSRQEEIGAVTTPLMFLLFIPFYMSMFMIPEQPDSTLVRVLSQVPIFSPFMMPMRSVFGGVTGWEIALAVVIALATIPVLVWIGARVYQRGVLHTGGRMKLTEALRG